MVCPPSRGRRKGGALAPGARFAKICLPFVAFTRSCLQQRIQRRAPAEQGAVLRRPCVATRITGASISVDMAGKGTRHRAWRKGKQSETRCIAQPGGRSQSPPTVGERSAAVCQRRAWCKAGWPLWALAVATKRDFAETSVASYRGGAGCIGRAFWRRRLVAGVAARERSDLGQSSYPLARVRHSREFWRTP